MVNMDNKILTALDIDNNQKLIDLKIDELVIDFNKKRIRKALKEKKIQLKNDILNSNVDINEADIEVELLPEDIEFIKSTLINDSETKTFREQQKLYLSVQKENYSEIRNIINFLNDLPFYASSVEKLNLQNHIDLLPYNEFVLLSVENNNFLHKIKVTIKNNIQEYQNVTNANGIKILNRLNFETNTNAIFTYYEKIRKMYQVPTSIDDIELFDRYDMKTNIDYSDVLSQLLLIDGATNYNFANKFIQNGLTSMGIDDTEFGMLTKIISNEQLSMLLSNRFIMNNSVTVLPTTYDINVERVTKTGSVVTRYVYRQRTLGELLLEIINPLNINKTKEERQQLYVSYDGQRPGKESYHTWNGMQVLDLDLKQWITHESGNIDKLKYTLHKFLVDFPWYLWICKSSSGNGLHIYTKVTPPHHVHLDIENNEYLSKYAFKINYFTKATILQDVLQKINSLSEDGLKFKCYRDNVGIINGYVDNQYFDDHVSRITTGIRIGYDNNPLINTNFIDLHYSLGLGQTTNGYSDYDSIEQVLFRKSKYVETINEELSGNFQNRKQYIDENVFVPDLTNMTLFAGNISDLRPLPKTSINYITRYNVCNTLASLYGKEGINLAHFLLDSTKCGNVGEINAFYSCALSNRKIPSKIGLDILQRNNIIKVKNNANNANNTLTPQQRLLAGSAEVDEQLKTDIAEKQTQSLFAEVTDEFKNELKIQIQKSLENTQPHFDYTLESNEYLSDKKDDLLSQLTGEKINIVFSPPGTGKTELIKQLAMEGKRIMLVLPYVSVITNKVEKDLSITEHFDAYYGSKDISKMDYGRNIVTTFDKFAKADYNKVSKMFDYVFIDESHLLFTSGYRIDTTATSIRKIKEIFYISNNDPFASKIVLMTGTETGEEHFFHNVSNIIRVYKKSNTKTLEFVICNNSLDATTRLAAKATMLLRDNYKIMIPTNKGEIYSEKIIGMIEYLMGREVKYGYYKRSNTEQEICRLINNDNTVGDYEIIFCSNYLSVGVDINDKDKFASLYLGNFCGYEIEQFNARIRKMGIKSIYCIPVLLSDGDYNPALISEPELTLRITDEDKLYFVDDKSISEAKTEFIATYDPILQKITTPGFSLMNGKIQFNLEEYELLSFEDKYNLCMEHPIKVARELSSYGYDINTTIEFNELTLAQQEELKQMGIESARQEKLRKHNLYVGTFTDLINQNSYVNYNGLEYTGTIDWIGKNNNLVIEDRDLVYEDNVTINNVEHHVGDIRYVQVIYDVFATPQQVIVRNREALDKMFRSAKYLINRYTPRKAMDILFKYVDENGILKQKNFHRAINLLKLLDSAESNELAEPLMRSLEKMYSFVDKFETNKDYKIGYQTYRSTLEAWTNEYIDMLGIKIHTKYGFDKIYDSLQEMLFDLSSKTQTQSGLRFTYNKLPEQNSSNVLNRRSIDTIVQNMFNILESEVNKKYHDSQTRHIIFEKQSF